MSEWGKVSGIILATRHPICLTLVNWLVLVSLIRMGMVFGRVSCHNYTIAQTIFNL